MLLEVSKYIVRWKYQDTYFFWYSFYILPYFFFRCRARRLSRDFLQIEILWNDDLCSIFIIHTACFFITHMDIFENTVKSPKFKVLRTGVFFGVVNISNYREVTIHIYPPAPPPENQLLSIAYFDKHIFRVRKRKVSWRRYFFAPKTYAPRHEISNNVVCATNKASDQPAHTRSLIRAFARRFNILWLLSYWLNIIWDF